MATRTLAAAQSKAKEKKLLIARTLEGLASGKLKPKDCELGICSNLSDAASCNGYYIVRTRAVGWGGLEQRCTLAPIGGPYGTENIWRGKYGKLRKELCAYIAKKLRSEVRKRNFRL